MNRGWMEKVERRETDVVPFPPRGYSHWVARASIGHSSAANHDVTSLCFLRSLSTSLSLSRVANSKTFLG